MLYYGRTDICEEIDPATSIFDFFCLAIQAYFDRFILEKYILILWLFSLFFFANSTISRKKLSSVVIFTNFQPKIQETCIFSLTNQLFRNPLKPS